MQTTRSYTVQGEALLSGGDDEAEIDNLLAVLERAGVKDAAVSVGTGTISFTGQLDLETL